MDEFDPTLDQPGPDGPHGETVPGALAPGEVVGEYRVLRQVGEGGMGVVYAAEQQGELRRIVALKVVKVGMDTREVVARFALESQALAVMDHECIARVFSAGATATGRPYFAMEFVDGVSIIDHCNTHRCGLSERLALFRRVCEGVHHAHQKGIIHRDLKPRNILVTIAGDEALPKIIDFGVARATNRHLHEQTVFTNLGQMVGTPEYMSPEQAEMTAQDIDTRSDVYSLGVILYELLTGALPFPKEELRRAGYDGICRIIREQDPMRPSTRISSLGERSTPVAAALRTDPVRLHRKLVGDLDWITMKALEKDRTRRYGSAEALALDIERYLKDLPVEAGPPGAGYRIRKFARRHRVGVAMAAIVSAVVVLGAIGTATGWMQARQSARQARVEAAAAREVSEFLIGLFAVNAPSEARGRSITAREVLDAGVQRIETELSGQPEVRARMMHTMGRVYSELGLLDEARPLLTRAASETEDHSTAGDAAVALVLDDLGRVLWRRGEYAEAEAVLGRSLDLRVRHHGAGHLAAAQGHESMGDLYWEMGRVDEAPSHYTAALAIREEHLGRDHTEVAGTLNKLGALGCQAGHYEEARPQFERALRIREGRLGTDHPDVAETLRHLGMLEMDLGEYDAAGHHFDRALANRRRNFGDHHYLVAQVWESQALLAHRRGRHAESLALQEQALELYLETLGDAHPYVATSYENLANLATEQGRFGEARAKFDAALAIRRDVLDEDNLRVACLYHNRGLLQQDMGLLAAARSDLDRAVEIRTRHLGQRNREVALSINALGFVHYEMGDFQSAERDFTNSLRIQEELLGPDHMDLSWNLTGLGNVQTLTGRVDQGLANLQRALAIREAILGSEHLDVAQTLNGLGLNRYIAGDADAASAAFARALAIHEKALPADHPDLVETCYNLACLSAKRGLPQEAMAYLERAAAGGFVNPGIDQDPDLAPLHDEPGYRELSDRIAGRR